MGLTTSSPNLGSAIPVSNLSFMMAYELIMKHSIPIKQQIKNHNDIKNL